MSKQNTPQKYWWMPQKGEWKYVAAFCIGSAVMLTPPIYWMVKERKEDNARLESLWTKAKARVDFDDSKTLDNYELTYLINTAREGQRALDAKRKAEGKESHLSGPGIHLSLTHPTTGEKDVRISPEGLEYVLEKTPKRTNYKSLDSWQDLN